MIAKKISNKIFRFAANYFCSSSKMDPYYNPDKLVEHGTEALKMIAEEIKNIEKYRVVPDVQPGFLR